MLQLDYMGESLYSNDYWIWIKFESLASQALGIQLSVGLVHLSYPEICDKDSLKLPDSFYC